MKRSSWIFAILIIVAFTMVRLQSTPAIPYPTSAVKLQQGIQIPVRMATPKDNAEFWSLMRKSNKQYVVTVFNNGRIVKQFAANVNPVRQSNAGSVFASTGSIKLGGITYQATDIYVSSTGKSGYIEFKTGKS